MNTSEQAAKRKAAELEKAAQRAAQLRDEYRERLVARQREGAEVVPS